MSILNVQGVLMSIYMVRLTFDDPRQEFFDPNDPPPRKPPLESQNMAVATDAARAAKAVLCEIEELYLNELTDIEVHKIGSLGTIKGFDDDKQVLSDFFKEQNA